MAFGSGYNSFLGRLINVMLPFARLKKRITHELLDWAERGPGHEAIVTSIVSTMTQLREGLGCLGLKLNIWLLDLKSCTYR